MITEDKMNTNVKAVNKKDVVKKYLFCYGLILIPIIHFIIFYVCVNINSLILPFQDSETKKFTLENFNYIIDMFKVNGELLLCLENNRRKQSKYSFFYDCQKRQYFK